MYSTTLSHNLRPTPSRKENKFLQVPMLSDARGRTIKRVEASLRELAMFPAHNSATVRFNGRRHISLFSPYPVFSTALYESWQVLAQLPSCGDDFQISRQPHMHITPCDKGWSGSLRAPPPLPYTHAHTHTPPLPAYIRLCPSSATFCNVFWG